MRKKDETLRATLLCHARALAETEGIAAVNMRAIAQRAGVATGTVYNYFAGKDDILFALTEESWLSALAELQSDMGGGSFCAQIEEIFAFLKARVDGAPGVLMQHLGRLEAAGQVRMAAMQADLSAALIARMDRDPQVRQDIWDETFTKTQYAAFLMRHLTMLLRSKRPDLRFLLEIVRRTLY